MSSVRNISDFTYGIDLVSFASIRKPDTSIIFVGSIFLILLSISRTVILQTATTYEELN